jgi:hypothetical protein
MRLLRMVPLVLTVTAVALGSSVATLANPGAPQHTTFHQGLQEGIDLRVNAGIHFRNAEVQRAALGQKVAALAAERLAPRE